MKRTLAATGITALLLLAFAVSGVSQTVTNPITAARLRATAWVFSAIQTFSAGVSVAAGSKIYLNGSANTAWIQWDQPSQCAQVYYGSALSSTICNGYVTPPRCLADTSLMAPGICYDALSGKMFTKTADGVVTQ